MPCRCPQVRVRCGERKDFLLGVCAALDATSLQLLSANVRTGGAAGWLVATRRGLRGSWATSSSGRSSMGDTKWQAPPRHHLIRCCPALPGCCDAAAAAAAVEAPCSLLRCASLIGRHGEECCLRCPPRVKPCCSLVRASAARPWAAPSLPRRLHVANALPQPALPCCSPFCCRLRCRPWQAGGRPGGVPGRHLCAARPRHGPHPARDAGGAERGAHRP